MTVTKARCLILACGNTLRSDDGVGPWLASWAEERFGGEAGMRVISRQQWTLELAEQIAAADSVLFVDCSVAVAAGSLSVMDVQPAALSEGVNTHQQGAAELLGLARVSFPQDYGTNDLFFGSSGQSDWDHKFAGTLDEVSLYNRALTASEIAAIYAADAGGKCQEAAVLASPQSQTVLVGSNVTLTVTAVGPALSYQWFFNGTNALAGATDSMLSLTNLSLFQSGSYTVVVDRKSTRLNSSHLG